MEEFSTALTTHYPQALELLKVVGPPLVALIVAIVASLLQFNQWRTARDKVRLDLFEQRLDVYNQLYLFFNEKVLKTQIAQDDYRPLEKAMSAAQFLFPDEVFGYLTGLKGLLEAHRDAFVRWQVEERRNSAVSDEQRHLGEVMQDAMDRFTAEWSKAGAVFSPYLSFGHIRR